MQAHEPIPHNHGTALTALLDDMPDTASFQRMADTFDQLGDGTRLKLLWLLCHCEDCVSDLAAAIGMSPPAVSHHLRILRQAGLITHRRVGKETHYTLAGTAEAQLVHGMIDALVDFKCTPRA